MYCDPETIRELLIGIFLWRLLFSYSMAIKHINGKVISRKFQGLEHIFQCHWLAIFAKAHLFIWMIFESLLYKAKKMLLIHARCSMDVSVHLDKFIDSELFALELNVSRCSTFLIL